VDEGLLNREKVQGETPMPVAIIGGGIAGSLMHHVLKMRGISSEVWDNKEPGTASRASSNLYIASWLKKFVSTDVFLGISVIEEVFKGKINHPFEGGIGDAMKVRHINSRDLLVEPHHSGFVSLGVEPGEDNGILTMRVRHGDSRSHTFSYIEHDGRVILARGVNDADMMPFHPNLEGMWGHCVRFRGNLPKGAASLKMPIPYKHFKFYQAEPEVIYFADSTTLARDTFFKRQPELREKLMQRAKDAFIGAGLDPNDYPMIDYVAAARPIIKSKPFGEIVRRTYSNARVFSMNGGGKNGIVAYAAMAAKIADELAGKEH
jgi:glycine/D-amino acid oxidase-like deaminating enzyme